MAMKYSDEFVWWAPKRKLGGGWVLFKDSPDPPQAPDPYAVADAQKGANLDAARTTATLNQVNQVNPFGSLTYTQDPNNPDSRTATTTVSPEVQHLIDTQLSLSGKMGDAASTMTDRATGALATPLDMSAIPTNQRLGGMDLPTAYTPEQVRTYQTGIGNDARSNAASFNGADVSGVNLDAIARLGVKPTQISAAPATTAPTLTTAQGAIAPNVVLGKDGLPEVQGVTGNTRQQVADALYNQAKSRLDPRFQQSESDLTSRLAANGITQGSQAYDREMQNAVLAKNDAYQTALNSSIVGAGTEEQRLQEMALATRGQLFGENATVADVEGRNADRTTSANLTNAQLANQIESLRGTLASTTDQANANREQAARESNAMRDMQAGTTNLATAADVLKFDAGQRTGVNLANSALSTNVNTNNAARADVIAAGNADRWAAAQNNDAQRALAAGTFNTSTGMVNNTQNLNNELAARNLNNNVTTVNNANRQQQLAEAITLRQQPLAELNMLRTGAQPTVPNFGAPATNNNVAPAPVAQAMQNQYAGNLNAYNTQVGSNNSFTGGLAQLGSAAMMAPTGTFASLAAMI